MGNLYKVILKVLGIKYGKKLKLFGFPIIAKKKKAKITIGNNVMIRSSFLSNLIGMYQRTTIIAGTDKANITIEDNVGMSGVAIFAFDKISIGKNTLIGANTKIFDSDFHPIDIESRNKDIKEKIKVKPTTIGEDCFIGCNSIILKGTTLGRGCVVGAGSVVSGTFEDNSIIAGNPAKVIRKI